MEGERLREEIQVYGVGCASGLMIHWRMIRGMGSWHKVGTGCWRMEKRVVMRGKRRWKGCAGGGMIRLWSQTNRDLGDGNLALDGFFIELGLSIGL